MILEQLPDDFEPWQFMLLDRPSLELVPYELKRWQCQAKGCNHFTLVRDYGIYPWYFLNRNSKRSHEKPKDYWYKLNIRFYMCGKHHKFYQRLIKKYDTDHVQNRICDFEKSRIVCLPSPK